MRIIQVGTKQIDLDTKQPISLKNSIDWLNHYEEETTETKENRKQLQIELRSRGWNVKVDESKPYPEKKFDICMASQWPFSNAAKCYRKKDHIGQHFSNDRLPKLVHWY